MELKGKKIGVALTGSFCTFEKTFQELQKLADLGAELHPILSNASQTISCRFGNPQMYLERLEAITGRKPILCIEGAEPIAHLADIGENGAIVQLKLLIGGGDAAAAVAMPHVVDADENRDHIGLKSQCVGVQSVKELIGAVAADAEVDEIKLDIGVILGDLLGGILGVALAHVVVVALVATRIGNAVALKQKSYFFHFTISP